MISHPKIIVDNRERNKELLDALGGLCSIHIETMDIGDYCISDRVCIERKTIRDFESSMITGRLFKQIKVLSENYKLPILIIEGDKADFILNGNSIEGAIIFLYLTYKIQIIISKNPKETAHILYRITKQEETLSDHDLSLKMGKSAKTDGQFMEYIIGNIPGVGNKIAKSLLTKFGSISSIVDADINDLTQVDKIGKKKSVEIYDILHKTYIDNQS